MGLDQYVYKVRADAVGEGDVDVELPASGNSKEQLCYWRKHPNLQGWMEQLYRECGGKDADFNCSNVRLTEDVLDSLEADVRKKALPSTQGFFFGQDDDSDEEQNYDLEAIRKCRAALKEGYKLFYSSWW